MPREDKKIKTKSLREREIYNEGVRDALKEVWLYGGVIPDDNSRAYLCREVQKKVSYKNPEPKDLVYIL